VTEVRDAVDRVVEHLVPDGRVELHHQVAAGRQDPAPFRQRLVWVGDRVGRELHEHRVEPTVAEEPQVAWIADQVRGIDLEPVDADRRRPDLAPGMAEVGDGAGEEWLELRRQRELGGRRCDVRRQRRDRRAQIAEVATDAGLGRAESLRLEQPDQLGLSMDGVALQELGDDAATIVLLGAWSGHG